MIKYNSPYIIGGLILYILFFIYFFLSNSLTNNFLIFSGIITIFGLIDDKYNLNYLFKFFFQILFCILFIFQFGNYESNFIISCSNVFLILLYLNAANFIDGSDGILPSLSIITLLSLYLNNNITEHTSFLLFFILSLIILFPFNLPNAKIYFGDAGSYLIGFTIMFLILENNIMLIREDFRNPIIIHFLKLLALSIYIYPIPVLDLIFAILRRGLSNENIFKGDKKHFHHFLNHKFKSKWATLLILSIAHVFIIKIFDKFLE